MKQREKCFKRIIIISLMLVVMVSSVAIAKASSSSRYLFVFEMRAYGGKDQSDAQIKDNSDNYAFVTFDSISAYYIDYPPYYRIRSGTNDKAASALQTFSMEHDDEVPYNSGFGQRGLPYYLRMQTDSNSSLNMTAEGYWAP